MNKIDEIEQYFKLNPPEGQYRFDKCSKVVDAKKFVTSHISFLRRNTGNKTFIVYFERLNKYYEHHRQAAEKSI